MRARCEAELSAGWLDCGVTTDATACVAVSVGSKSTSIAFSCALDESVVWFKNPDLKPDGGLFLVAVVFFLKEDLVFGFVSLRKPVLKPD